MVSPETRGFLPTRSIRRITRKFAGISANDLLAGEVPSDPTNKGANNKVNEKVVAEIGKSEGDAVVCHSCWIKELEVRN